MNFNQWWATLTDKEQKLLGQHNARFVWDAAATAEREACAKIVDDSQDGITFIGDRHVTVATAIRARNNND